MSENIQKHISLLGFKVRDLVTGKVGIVTSVGFDLYGCVQAIVHPGMDADGKMGESLWFDVARLEVMDKVRVMPLPDYDHGVIAEGRKGAAEKPAITGY